MPDPDFGNVAFLSAGLPLAGGTGEVPCWLAGANPKVLTKDSIACGTDKSFLLIANTFCAWAITAFSNASGCPARVLKLSAMP